MVHRIEGDFLLLFRTENLSPPVIDIFSLASAISMVSGVASLINTGREWRGSIKGKSEAQKEKQKEKTELYYNLFGFCANADFITNQLDRKLLKMLENEEEVWLTSDLVAAEETVGHFINIFEEMPIVNLLEDELRENPEEVFPQFERNIVSLGGPCRNRFSRWMMKLETPPTELNIDIQKAPDLPFVFDYDLPISKDKSWEERLNLSPKPNWPIKDVRSNYDVYIPEMYYDDNNHICKKDYAMIVKMKSIHKKGKEDGKWNLVLGGCHGSGTEGAAMALGNEKILQEIWDEVKDREFQVILAVDVEAITRPCGSKERKIGKPRRVELLEIIDLTERR